MKISYPVANPKYLPLHEAAHQAHYESDPQDTLPPISISGRLMKWAGLSIYRPQESHAAERLQPLDAPKSSRPRKKLGPIIF